VSILLPNLFPKKIPFGRFTFRELTTQIAREERRWLQGSRQPLHGEPGSYGRERFRSTAWGKRSVNT